MTMKQLSSVTTTNLKAVRSSTSMPPTELGVVDLSATDKQQAVAQLLKVDDPVQVTRKVTDSVLTLVPSMKAKHARDFTLLSYSIGKYEEKNICQAIRNVNRSLAGMLPKDIEKCIATIVPLLTLPKDLDATMLASKGRTLAAELAKYPADIVMQSFEEIKKRSTFYPSFAEFYKHIEPRYLPRKYLLDALQKCIVKKSI